MRKSGGSYAPNDVIFRLAEAYLNYAEALNEVSRTCK
ncbi:RagB/SusD family nutrient uptake outer membrane protein [Proteiniphilum sp. UBA5510]